MKTFFIFLVLLILTIHEVSKAETRAELDDRYRSAELNRFQPVPYNEGVKFRGTGFYADRMYKVADSTFFPGSPVATIIYRNELILRFACADESSIGSIPMKFKNIEWKILDKSTMTNAREGKAQSDQNGEVLLNIQSNYKDLSEVQLQIHVENEIYTLRTDEGPYNFPSLPLSTCKLSKN